MDAEWLPKFEYTHNVNLPVVANRDYIIRIIKHSNGNSRYSIAYNFIADKSEIIHGHQLPPQPDPDLNNATLGGVDSNGNGVRDDVERAIYKKYDKKLHAVLVMDAAKALQQTLVQPLENAKNLQKGLAKTLHCEIYLGDIDSLIMSDEFRVAKYLENVTFTTPERVRRYLDYNRALSGGNYATNPEKDWVRDSCSQEVQDVLEEMGQ